MLNHNTKQNALAAHEKAIGKYNTIIKAVEVSGEQLYALRKKNVVTIQMCENLISSVANTPKEFGAKLVKIDADIIVFQNTESYAAEAYHKAKTASAGLAAGVGAGAAVAAMAPTAAMWVATTFGTASTGTAISSLSGAVATKAALAWLGGGALAAGGAGIAGGQALLALAGPVGWSLAAVAVGGNIFSLNHKNKQIAQQAMDEAKTITFAGAQMNKSKAIIEHIHKQTQSLSQLVEEQLIALRSKKGSQYEALTPEEQLGFGALVNNTLSLSELLNKTVTQG